MPTSNSTKPEFQRVDDQFYWRPPVEGEPVEYVIPLKFKTGFYRRMAVIPDPLQQLAMVLTEVELPKVLEMYDDLEIDDGLKVAGKYFEAFNARSGALLGE